MLFRSYVYGASKVLDMLGYGSFLDSSQTVNALPFLAYQKVYFDFYSNSQWEKHLAYAYNVDYWTGGSSIALSADMLKLRYANYPKDYFMGMLPASQYGNVAALPSTLDMSRSPNTLLLSNSSSKSFSYLNNPAGSTTVVASESNNSVNLHGGHLFLSVVS